MSANIAESPRMLAIHCATVGGGSSIPGRYFFRVRHDDRVIAANPVLIRLARQMREPPVAARLSLCAAEDSAARHSSGTRRSGRSTAGGRTG